jgi:undecaprenyl-diphosphatase
MVDGGANLKPPPPLVPQDSRKAHRLRSRLGRFAMSILEAVTLGIVQGLTEFLPISSTAHLRVVPAILGWDDPGAAFSAVIQCGTLVAVCVALRRDIVAIVAGFVEGLRTGRPLATVESRTAILIALGTLPIVAVGFAARHLIRTEARRLEVVTAALLAATALMAAAEAWCAWRARRGEPGRDGLEGVRFRDGLAMGMAQVLALVPGTSRSGVTISAGMFAGLDRRTAARFSFLLSLPAVAAAGLLEAWQQRQEILGTPEAVAAAVWGTLAAAIVGYAAIRWLLRILTSHTLWPFIAYRIALALLLAWSLSSGWVPALS